MKPRCARLPIALRCILVTLSWAAVLSCAGDGAIPLGALQQAFTRETPPPSPRPFDLPGEPIVRGAEGGYLPGSGHVTPDGAYTYTLPIDVPPGRGIQPELALAYSSRAGIGGLLGVGFSLRGPSLIARCHKTLSIDGVVDGIDGDESDVFCLDGQRLVSVRGRYGADGTEYRTAEETFTKVISYGRPQPARFRVWLNDGRIRDYEKVGPLDWRMTQEQDRSGNTVRHVYVEWDQETEEFVLQKIEYLDHRIEFGYRDEDGFDRRPDMTTLYAAGEPLPRNQLLRSISVYGPNPKDVGLLWRYDLGYEQSAETRRSRLVSVRRCGGLGGCFKARQFTWSSRHGDRFEEATVEEHPWYTDAQDPIVLDVDGDGKDEVLFGTIDLEVSTPYLLLRTPPGGRPLSSRELATRPVRETPFFGMDLETAVPVDAGGDGTSALFSYNVWARQFELHKWNGSAFEAAGMTVPLSPELLNVRRPGRREPFHFADVDGDGLADLIKLLDSEVQRGSGGYRPRWVVRRNLPDGTFGRAEPTGLTTDLLDPGAVSSEAIDVQGDGRGGLWPKGASLAVYPDDAGGFSAVKLPMSRLEDVVSSDSPVFHSTIVDSLMADLNGDGLRDLLHHHVFRDLDEDHWLTVSWNTGKGFSTQQAFTEYRPPYPSTIQAADLDGDGREELVVSNNKPPRIQVAQLEGMPIHYPWKGDWMVESIAVPPARIDAVRLGDFNGDGLLDVMYFAERCVDPEPVTRQGCSRHSGVGSVRVLLQKSTVIDVVTAVSDEEGVQREEIQVSRQWTDAPERATCGYPQVCHRRGLPVVRKHVLSEGANLPRTLHYAYDDPRSDRRGRGFLGFGELRVWEPQVPRETVTTFDHATRNAKHNGRYPFAGRPKTVTVVTPILESGPGGPSERPGRAVARVMRTTHRYEDRALNGGATYAVFPHAWESREWEEDVAIDWRPGVGAHITEVDGPGGVVLRTRSGATRFDDWGSLKSERTETAGGVRTTVATRYEHRPEQWLLSLPRWQEVTSTVPGGARSETRRTTFSWDEKGRIEAVEIEPFTEDRRSPEENVVIRYEHDAEGLLRRVTQAAPGVPTRRVHLDCDGTPGRTAPSVVWNDLGHAQWFAVHPGYGVVMAEMDANGQQTTRIHDDLGRPVRSRPHSGAEVTWRYEQRWNGVTVHTSDETGASGVVELDVSGRPRRVGHAGHDGAMVWAYTKYDVLGRVVQQSRPTRRLDEARWSTRVYDSLDRLLQVRGADGTATRYQHGFLESASWDPRGSHKKLVRDLDGRVVQSVSYLGVTDLSDGHRFVYRQATELVTRYEYGPFDQLERIVDPRSNVTTMAYDTRGRRTLLVDPDQGTTRFYFNGLGDLWKKTEGDDDETVYERDVRGRAYRVADGDGATELQWDTAEHGMGRLAATVSPDGTATAYMYDEHGRLKEAQWTIRGEEFAIRTGYDEHGRLETLAYPEIPGERRFTIKHGYDARGRLDRITDITTSPRRPGEPLWHVEARSDEGALERASYGSGVTMDRAYDPDTGRLLRQIHRSGETLLSSLTYDYYADGRVKQRFEERAQRGERYVYDTLQRLRQWTLSNGSDSAPRATEYRYDRLGNLTGVLVDGVERERNRYDDPRPHAVSSNLDGAFVYDARGRMTEGIDRSLVYTSFDLPREIITPAGVTHFDYDASGARVRKDGPAGTTVSIAGLYERRRTDAGTKHVLLVPGSDGLTVAQVIVDPARSGRDKRQVQYLHQDALGSVTLVTDERGNADASARAYYEPFGRRIQADGTPVAGPLADLRLGLTGHGHDDELGLIDLKGRIYDPVLKRVLTPDPLVSLPLVGQSYNRFSYALNDPINLVDPTGYQAGIGPDCGSCQLWVVPPIVDGGGIQSGQSGSGSTAWESVPQKIDWGEIQSLPSPPIRASSIDGTQSSAAVPYHGGFLGGLTYERQRAERLRYEADQQAALRGAVVGAGAALVIWSGGAALFAIEEITVLGGAIGTTATQVAATGALRTTTVVVPLLLGEYSIIEGLRRNDPGRIADGLMMAMSGGATFGTGLGSGPRAGGHLVGAAGGTTQAASQGFRSFSAFKRVMGPAGEGMQWHHIVQQTQGNVARFGSEAIHNTGNLVRLEIGVHRQVNGYYSSIQDFTGGQTVRRWLSTQSFEAQVEFGRGVLQRFGVTP